MDDILFAIAIGVGMWFLIPVLLRVIEAPERRARKVTAFAQWQNGAMVLVCVVLSLACGAIGGLMVWVAVALGAEFLFGAGAAFEDLGLAAVVIGARTLGVVGIGRVVRLGLSDRTEEGPRLEEGLGKKEAWERQEAERLERARQCARERGHLKEP
jgi:hypothetical protein